jgi:hypothetical protein
MKNRLKNAIKASLLKLFRVAFNFLNRHPRLHGKVLYYFHKWGLHKKIKRFYYRSILKLNEEYSDQMIGPVVVDIPFDGLTLQAKNIHQEFQRLILEKNK